MQKMPIDMQERPAIAEITNDMTVPDFLKDGVWHVPPPTMD